MAIRFGKCGVEGGVKIFSLSNWLDVSVNKQDKEHKNQSSRFVLKIITLLLDLLSES